MRCARRALRVPNWVSTRNPCKACAPLGAALVMRGIAGALPFLHGSQGCATYMRRYIISHFREPMDIATSGFSEASTIFGGGAESAPGSGKRDLAISSGLDRNCDHLPDRDDRRRRARVACMSTAQSAQEARGPLLVHVSTPSYSGTHIDGFNDAVRAVVEQLAEAECESRARMRQFCQSFPGAGVGGGSALSEGSGSGFRAYQ